MFSANLLQPLKINIPLIARHEVFCFELVRIAHSIRGYLGITFAPTTAHFVHACLEGVRADWCIHLDLRGEAITLEVVGEEVALCYGQW